MLSVCLKCYYTLLCRVPYKLYLQRKINFSNSTFGICVQNGYQFSYSKILSNIVLVIYQSVVVCCIAFCWILVRTFFANYYSIVWVAKHLVIFSTGTWHVSSTHVIPYMCTVYPLCTCIQSDINHVTVNFYHESLMSWAPICCRKHGI